MIKGDYGIFTIVKYEERGISKPEFPLHSEGQTILDEGTWKNLGLKLPLPGVLKWHKVASVATELTRGDFTR